MEKLPYLFVFLTLFGCGATQKTAKDAMPQFWETPGSVIKIAFGSCNKHDVENVFWDDVLHYRPDIWIWGGDNVYADTGDRVKLGKIYDAQHRVPAYAELKKKVHITGVWDDHDYGKNDGGAEFWAKADSQAAFLRFMDVPKSSPRWGREGTYSSKVLQNDHGSVKVINLDTRYFRSGLKQSTVQGHRYGADTTSTKTLLGNAQWQWLQGELQHSKADFNVIVSSIQFLSDQHGFEKWANFPHEVEKMKRMITKSGAKGVLFLSGDRHFSEFSELTDWGMAYPLIDFTSSGLTHSYSDFSGEPNPFRVGEVVSTISYGLVELDLKTKKLVMRMMGDNAEILQQKTQQY